MKIFGIEIKRSVPYQDATKGFMSTYFQSVGSTPVTETSAYSISAYWAGVRRISESVAMLPIDVLRKRNGVREQVDHPSEYLLNKEANYKSIAFDFKQIMITSAINYGNGFALIERDSSAAPIGLSFIHPERITPKEYDEELFWELKISYSSKTMIIKDEDIINLRGFGNGEVLGLSAIKYHKQNLGLAIAAQDYGADFYNKGTRLDGYIEYQGKLDMEVKKKIASSWNDNYGPNGTGGTAILDNGTKYTRLGLPPEDAQFIETRKFQKNEVATILGIPPYMINEMGEATYNNVEHQGIEFVTYSLGSWIEKLEQEYARKLLRENEKRTHYFKHNVNRLLRTDVKARAEFYRMMSDVGVYSINEIRGFEDMNPIEGGDQRFIQLNRVELSIAKEYYERDNTDSGNKSDKLGE